MHSHIRHAPTPSRVTPLCRVLAADLHGLEPAAHDKTLYPSDHAALRVELQIRRDPSALLPGGIQVASTVNTAAAAGAGGKL